MSNVQLMAAAAGVASIRIISRAHEGFRRGGIAHPADATYPLDRFTPGQLEQIQSEPLLTTMITAPVSNGQVSLSVATPAPAPAPASIVEPPLPDGVAAAPGQPSPLTPEERLKAMLGLVPSLTVGDFTAAGVLRAEARRRAAATLGFEPSDEELRAAGEAHFKRLAENT